MKKIDRIVLGQLAKKELTQRQLGKIKGGNLCTCGCCYYPNGGGADGVTNGDTNCVGNKKHCVLPTVNMRVIMLVNHSQKKGSRLSGESLFCLNF